MSRTDSVAIAVDLGPADSERDVARLFAAHGHAARGVAGLACLGLAAVSAENPGSWTLMRRQVSADLEAASGLLRAPQSDRTGRASAILSRAVESARALAAEEARPAVRANADSLSRDWVALRLKPIVGAIRAAEELSPDLASTRRSCDHGLEVGHACVDARHHPPFETRGRHE